MLPAFLIFLATLVLIIWQPRGLGIGWSASAGAIAALLFGVIQPADIPVVWNIVWNATGAFVAPLLTPDGCVGVLALEFDNGGEEHELVHSLVSIISAQLSTLFPTSSHRPVEDARWTQQDRSLVAS